MREATPPSSHLDGERVVAQGNICRGGRELDLGLGRYTYPLSMDGVQNLVVTTWHVKAMWVWVWVSHQLTGAWASTSEAATARGYEFCERWERGQHTGQDRTGQDRKWEKGFWGRNLNPSLRCQA